MAGTTTSSGRNLVFVIRQLFSPSPPLLLLVRRLSFDQRVILTSWIPRSNRSMEKPDSAIFPHLTHSFEIFESLPLLIYSRSDFLYSEYDRLGLEVIDKFQSVLTVTIL